jgi:hypothetical protein
VPPGFPKAIVPARLSQPMPARRSQAIVPSRLPQAIVPTRSSQAIVPARRSQGIVPSGLPPSDRAHSEFPSDRAQPASPKQSCPLGVSKQSCPLGVPKRAHSAFLSYRAQPASSELSCPAGFLQDCTWSDQRTTRDRANIPSRHRSETSHAGSRMRRASARALRTGPRRDTRRIGAKVKPARSRQARHRGLRKRRVRFCRKGPADIISLRVRGTEGAQESELGVGFDSLRDDFEP